MIDNQRREELGLYRALAVIQIIQFQLAGLSEADYRAHTERVADTNSPRSNTRLEAPRTFRPVTSRCGVTTSAAPADTPLESGPRPPRATR